MANELGARGAAARRQSSALSLVRSAERLFGRQGIDGVSLREIAAAAGHRNINAVQYHFGDKAGLVRAIYEYNIPIMDKRRGELLTELKGKFQLAPLPDLVRCFFQALVDNVDDDGLHSYAAFHNQALNSPAWRISWAELMALAPVSRVLMDMMRSQLPPASEDIIGQRFIYATLIILNALSLSDAGRTSAEYYRPFSTQLLDDAFESATRIFFR